MGRILISGENWADRRPSAGAQHLNLAEAGVGPEDLLAARLAQLGACNLSEIELEYDPELGAVWCYQLHAQRPNFTEALIGDVKTVQSTLKRELSGYQDLNQDENSECRYLIWASRRRNIFNLGGDLSHFVHLLGEGDRDGMHAYARSCIEICYSNYLNLDLPITTVSLASGDALGGGLESLLTSDIVVAEKSAQFGFPEILFGLFPGMGAYSFVSRRAGPKVAKEMIFSGRIYRGEQLYDMGLVDVLAPDGEGEATLHAHLHRHRKKYAAHRALYSVRREVEKITWEELADISDRWVDTAMNLGGKDIKKMRRLAKAQIDRLARGDQAAPVVSGELNGAHVSVPGTGTDTGTDTGAAKFSTDVQKKDEVASAEMASADIVPILNTSQTPISFISTTKRTKNMNNPSSNTTEPTTAPIVANPAATGDVTEHGVYETILEEVAEARAAATLQPGVERLLSEGMDRDEYLEFVEQLYHIVWHFCPTMAAAAARCSDDMRELRYALYHQIEEEKGHETWVLDDAIAMGATAEDVISSTPAIPVRALIGYNYSVAERGNPWAVLGMVHVLEEISANYSGRVANSVANRLGITDGSGFRFLGSHGVMDVCHVNSFKDLVENVKSREDIDAIVQAAEVNFALFGALFRDA